MIRKIVIYLIILSLVVLAPLKSMANVVRPIDSDTEKALIAAWNDAKQAEILYQSIIYRFGRIPIFVSILKDERQHEEMLMSLLLRYGLEPTDNNRIKSYSLKTLDKAYQLAIEKEKVTITLYEENIKLVKLPCVWHTFGYIKNESKEKHLPAFQNALAELEKKNTNS